jgi:hypothetical protein
MTQNAVILASKHIVLRRTHCDSLAKGCGIAVLKHRACYADVAWLRFVLCTAVAWAWISITVEWSARQWCAVRIEMRRAVRY